MLLKLPPPYIGPALASEIILKSKLKESYEIIHLDTSDHRDINTLGKFDIMNFLIAFKQYLQLIYYIVKYNPQIVYFPNAQTTVAYLRDIPLILISKFLGKKVVGHLRGGNFKNWYESASKLTQYCVKKIHPLFDRQIVLGDCLIHMYEGVYPENKISVVPNGRNFDFKPNYKISKNEEVKILYLANFHKSKGVIDTLESVKYLIKLKGKIKFYFAGNWRAEETQIEFNEIANHIPKSMIEVVGLIKGKEKEALLLRADIFVFPTYYPNEGHPWVIVEAIAAGLPVISCEHAAISQSVKHGINGFLVEKQNPKQIAEKLELLIENKELREKMGRESRRLYEENFTEDKMVERLKQVFDTVIGDKT